MARHYDPDILPAGYLSRQQSCESISETMGMYSDRPLRECGDSPGQHPGRPEIEYTPERGMKEGYPLLLEGLIHNSGIYGEGYDLPALGIIMTADVEGIAGDASPAVLGENMDECSVQEFIQGSRR